VLRFQRGGYAVSEGADNRPLLSGMTNNPMGGGGDYRGGVDKSLIESYYS
jgi:hypothetical protein